MKTKRKRKIHVRSSNIDRRGVFASDIILPGEKIIQYTGRKHAKKNTFNINQDYLFELNRHTDIEGRNIARYINHSCQPNAEADVIRGEIWIQAIRQIKEGEEITYNYGYSLTEGLNYPCECGTSKCVGYILSDDEWPKLRRLKKTRRRKITA